MLLMNAHAKLESWFASMHEVGVGDMYWRLIGSMYAAGTMALLGIDPHGNCG